jgi:hypothetical protein
MKKTDLKNNNGVTTQWMIELSKEAWNKWAGYITTAMLGTDVEEGDSLYLDFKDQNGDQYSTHIFSDEYVLVHSSEMIDMEEYQEYLCTIKYSDLIDYLDGLPKTALGVFNGKAIPYDKLPSKAAKRIKED